MSFRQACVAGDRPLVFSSHQRINEEKTNGQYDPWSKISSAVPSGDRNDIGGSPSLMNSGVLPALTFQLLALL